MEFTNIKKEKNTVTTVHTYKTEIFSCCLFAQRILGDALKLFCTEFSSFKLTHEFLCSKACLGQLGFLPGRQHSHSPTWGFSLTLDYTHNCTSSQLHIEPVQTYKEWCNDWDCICCASHFKDDIYLCCHNCMLPIRKHTAVVLVFLQMGNRQKYLQ